MKIFPKKTGDLKAIGACLAWMAMAAFWPGTIACCFGAEPGTGAVQVAGQAAPEKETETKSAKKPERVPLEGEPLVTGEVPILEVEPIGKPNGCAIYKVLPAGRANDQSPWRQLITFKKDKRTSKKSYFASIDFAKGTVRELPVTIPSINLWGSRWVAGKQYLLMNCMGHLAVYDPTTDVLTDLGEAFEGEKRALTLYSMAVSPDGVLALGGGSGTDLATYDPRTKSFTRYGKIGGAGTAAGYVYRVSMDEQFIYGAVRGTGPWELVAINRKTRERKVLTSCPAGGFIDLMGNEVQITTPGPGDDAKLKTWHLLSLGTIELLKDPRDPRLKREPRETGFTGSAPEVFVDDTGMSKGEGFMKVFIQSPDAKEKFNEGKIEAGLASDGLLHIAALEDGRIAGVTRGYIPMVIADPKGQNNDSVPFDDLSCYSVLAAGKRIFATGYPSVGLVVYDTSKPQTPLKALPGKPAVPSDSKEANARKICQLAKDTGGGHVGACLTAGTDGRVYLIARRHRYFYGFALAWCDVNSLETGVFKDAGAFDHYQIGWMSALDQGRKLVIATRVQYNKQISGTAPEEGALFVFDVKEQKIVAKYTPLPKVRILQGVVQTGPEELVGVGQLESGSSVLYRLNLKTGKTELTRTYKATICGRGEGDMAVPVRSNGFVLGPDGQVWAGATETTPQMNTYIFRINPKDLGCSMVGRLYQDQYNQLLFSNGELYTTGGAAVQRIKNWKALAGLK